MKIKELLEKLKQLKHEKIKRSRELDEETYADSKYQGIQRQIEEIESALTHYLFGFNTEAYASIQGLVTDKKPAIELLCRTPEAWAVLDESLKSDPEIIMYYQPLGHKDVSYYDVDPEENGCCMLLSSEVLSQKGFETVSYYDLKKSGLISSINESRCYVSKPKISFPEGFDYETYFKIQSELSKSKLDFFVSSETEGRLFGFADSDRFHVYSEEPTIYDRSLLIDIVSKYYVPTTGEAVKTIGTHPAM